ncbi:hypothetical protein JCM8547_006505 [Rhodosporidiobolus lusitaniae]
MVFERLWHELSTDSPPASTSWNALAAPFWLTHVEAFDKDHATKAAKKHQLIEPTRSFHFDPELPVFDPHEYIEPDSDYYCNMGSDYYEEDQAQRARTSTRRPCGRRRQNGRTTWARVISSSSKSVLPAAATLKSLKVRAKNTGAHTDVFLVSRLFAGCAFPRLIRASFGGVLFPDSSSPFIDAPALLEVEIGIVPQGSLPVCPPSVQHLSVTALKQSYLPLIESTVQQAFADPSSPHHATFKNLRTFSLELLDFDPTLTPGELALVGVAPSDPRETALYDPANPIELEAEESLGAELKEGDELSEGEDGEEDELDWDAEEDPKFREFWTVEKRRGYNFAQALSAIRPHFPSNEAFEAGKEAMTAAAEPFW